MGLGRKKKKEHGCEEEAGCLRSEAREESKKRLRDYRKEANFEDEAVQGIRSVQSQGLKKKRSKVIGRHEPKMEVRGGAGGEMEGLII